MQDWKAAQAELAAPFPAEDVEWRIGRAGEKGGNVWAMCLAYVTNRAIQNRLDAVFGIDGWRNEYAAGPEGGVVCGLSVWHDERKAWITKYDGAPATDIEAVKGGLSDSMKRAAVQWGIGRYLYRLPEGWADCASSRSDRHINRGEYKGSDGQKHTFWWAEPALPAWALPNGEAPKAAPAPRSTPAAPAPPRPAAATPKANPAEPGHRITVDRVEAVERTNKTTGSKFMAYGIYATSGDIYSTLNKDLADAAQDLSGKDAYVEFAVSGKYRNLISIEEA